MCGTSHSKSCLLNERPAIFVCVKEGNSQDYLSFSLSSAADYDIITFK